MTRSDVIIVFYLISTLLHTRALHCHTHIHPSYRTPIATHEITSSRCLSRPPCTLHRHQLQVQVCPISSFLLTTDVILEYRYLCIIQLGGDQSDREREKEREERERKAAGEELNTYWIRKREGERKREREILPAYKKASLIRYSSRISL